ncbi:MAG: MFS transporter [Chloroflexi bacterium]|nr:MAG: MFS transporter [Chloroflexota bacterium]
MRDSRARRLLVGLAVSSLGDGISTVTIAWLALAIAPPHDAGVYVGLALAAYTLPGMVGGMTLGRFFRRRSPKGLVIAHSIVRTGSLAAIATLSLPGALHPTVYVLLLAVSSLLVTWGNAGEYSLLADVGGAQGRLAANSLASAQVSMATIIGPLAAGILLTRLAAGWLLAIDAASFAVLGIVVAGLARAPAGPIAESEQPSGEESGFRLLRRRELLGLTVVTWFFFFLYGPVEVALPVHVARELHASAQLLGAYWTSYALGALAASLVTGALRTGNVPAISIAIIAGWGACLLPFSFAPVPVTLVCFAAGGLIYGPFNPLTYALFQSATPAADLPAVLAARGTVVIVSTPLGIALGGPLVSLLGGGGTLVASGLATVMLAAVSLLVWPREPAFGRPEPIDRELTET